MWFKRVYILILLFIPGFASFGQESLLINSIENVVKLDFSSQPPAVQYTGIASTTGSNVAEGIAHVEDVNGTILFWINSAGVFDKNGNLMPNSPGIFANPSSTEIVVCQVPESVNKYYIIYNNLRCSELYYSTINLNLNNGFGDVEEKNKLINSNHFAEGLEIVRIPCTNNYRLIAYECNTGLYSFRIDETGISTGSLIYNHNISGYDEGRGEIEYYKGKLGVAFINENEALFADYDPDIDNISNVEIIQFDARNGMYGLEFSPDAEKVYLTDWNNVDPGGNIVSANLFRYNFESHTIDEWYIYTKFEICRTLGYGDHIGQIEMGKDGKLYIPKVCKSEIFVINNPNENFITFDSIPLIHRPSLGISDHIQSEFVNTEINVSNDTTICEGESVQLFIEGVSNPYWKPFFIFDDPYSVTPIASPDSTILVTVYFEDVFGCDDSLSILLTIIPDTISGIISGDPFICEGESTVLTISNSYSSFQWRKDGVEIPGAISNSLLVNEEGEYDVEINDGFCTSFSELFKVEFYSEFEVFIHGVDFFCTGETTTLFVNDDFLFYQWFYMNDTLRGENQDFLIVNEEGYYQVTVNNGYCDKLSPFFYVKDSLCFYCEPQIGIPDAFSPNGDGNNDYYQVFGECISFFELFIFNRWGEIIYHTNNMEDTWDGIYKGAMVPSGAYAYLIRYSGIFTEEKIIEKVGSIIVLR